MFNALLRVVQAVIQPIDILTELTQLQKRIEEMALNVDHLKAEVTRVQTVQASAVKLIDGLVAELEAVKVDLAQKLLEANAPVDTSALDALVEDLKASTDGFAAAVADSWDAKDTKEVILNADNPETPTVSVIMPEVLPENVEVTTEVLVDEIDPASSEPQVAVVVEEPAPAPAAEEAPAEPTVEAVLSTEEGLVDVVMTAPEAAVEELKAEGVDVMAAVTEAYEATEEVTAAPVAEEPAPAPEAPAAEEPKAE